MGVKPVYLVDVNRSFIACSKQVISYFYYYSPCSALYTLVEAERVIRTYTGDTTFVLEDPLYRWHYLSRQRDDEVAIFRESRL
jgi:hypothetical protein